MKERDTQKKENQEGSVNNEGEEEENESEEEEVGETQLRIANGRDDYTGFKDTNINNKGIEERDIQTTRYKLRSSSKTISVEEKVQKKERSTIQTTLESMRERQRARYMPR